MKFEIATPQIVFANQPRLTGREADKDFDRKRIELVAQIQNLLFSHELFKGKEIKVTFVTKGVSSLVSVIETREGKTVLKIPLSTHYSRGESEFLKVWEANGIKVPHVIEQGTLGEHEYMLMEYVDAPVLNDKYTKDEMVEKEIYREMGMTLRAMHTPQATGYGRLVNGVAEYQTFSEWIDSEDMDTRITYAEEHKLFDEVTNTFKRVREILIAHASATDSSSYCHDDYGADNIFATEPITIFDPNPRFNNGYIDLGRSVMIHTSLEVPKGATQQIVDGYFNGEVYDARVLHASIILAAFMKSRYLHQINKPHQITTIRKYLEEKSSLL